MVICYSSPKALILASSLAFCGLKKRGVGGWVGIRLISRGKLLNFLPEYGHQTSIVLNREECLSSQEVPAHYKRAPEKNGRNKGEVSGMNHKL